MVWTSRKLQKSASRLRSSGAPARSAPGGGGDGAK